MDKKAAFEATKSILYDLFDILAFVGSVLLFVAVLYVYPMVIVFLCMVVACFACWALWMDRYERAQRDLKWGTYHEQARREPKWETNNSHENE